MNEHKKQRPLDNSETDRIDLQHNPEPASRPVFIANRLLNKLKSVTKHIKSFFSFIVHFCRTNSQGSEDGSVSGDIRLAFTNFNTINVVAGCVVITALLYSISGIYVVNPGERAVVKLFGKPVNQGVEEGMHYRLPWPFQTVDIVNISTIRREGVGLLLQEHETIHSSPRVVQFLSGDNNIVDIQAVVQYRIKNAADFLYNINYPPYQMINDVLRSSITEIGGSMNVDDILTIGKERLQEMIRTEAQSLLDQYGSGMQLVGINLKKVYPPEDVAEAFRDVSNARQDQEKLVSNAAGYRNTVIPQARGDAEKNLRQAEGYKTAAINKASGEAGRFEQMLTEYKRDQQKYTEDVTTTRLYLESMEKVLAKVRKYIVNPANDGDINLRLLQR